MGNLGFKQNVSCNGCEYFHTGMKVQLGLVRPEPGTGFETVRNRIFFLIISGVI